MACLPELPQLQSLGIDYLDISDRAIDALDSQMWLSRLNICHTDVSNAAMIRLVNEKAHTLTNLDVSNTSIRDETLAELPEDSRLDRLNLKDTAVTDDGLKHFSRAPYLEHLLLDLCDVGDDGIRHLEDCRTLRELELFQTKVTDTSFVWLSDSKIKYLGVGGTQISDAGMPSLTDFSELQSLDISHTQISDRGLRFLSQAQQLENLDVEYTKITNRSLDFLRPLRLKSLSLNVALDDSGFRTLSRLPELRHLAITGKVASWKPLSRVSDLETLLLVDHRVDLSAIGKMRSLRNLLLSGEHFPLTTVLRLHRLLPECSIRRYRSHQTAKRDFRTLGWSH